MFVDRSIVHEQHHPPTLKSGIGPDIAKHRVYEVLKNGGVNPTLDELVGEYLMLRDGREQRE